MTSVNPASADISTRHVADLCDRAAANAAREIGVPLDVLMAISRTETGRTRSDGLQPWPWTVNMEGVGKWFATEDAARAFVFKHFKTGARSFDVGCFQINYRWHGHSFRSIDEMFDPLTNAIYAARFVKGLFSELGSWTAAAGAYHSRTPKYSEQYVKKFKAIRASISGELAEIDERAGENALLARAEITGKEPKGALVGVAQSGTKSLGSLVPILRSKDRLARILIDLE